MSAAPLDAYRGALVRDMETGFVGVLVDVIPEFTDPQRISPPQDKVFIRQRGGGRERTANPSKVQVLEKPPGQGCLHSQTVQQGGKTYCASCGAQIYL